MGSRIPFRWHVGRNRSARGAWERRNWRDATIHGPPQGRGRADRRGVAEAHRKDQEIQSQYGVTYHRYWFNEQTGEVFCLAEAPNKEAAEAVHREAHGLVADEIVEVK
jgi:hypothetical protein